jgi:hypothetical protein
MPPPIPKNNLVKAIQANSSGHPFSKPISSLPKYGSIFQSTRSYSDLLKSARPPVNPPPPKISALPRTQAIMQPLTANFKLENVPKPKELLYHKFMTN